MRRAILLAVLVGTGCGGTPLVKDKIGDDPGGLLWNGYTKPEANCFHCHNGDGHGTALGPDLGKRVPGMTDAEVENVIKNGKPKTIMEPYGGKLSDAEIATLAAWLRKEFPGGPAAAATPAPAAPAAPAATPSPGAAPATPPAPK